MRREAAVTMLRGSLAYLLSRAERGVNRELAAGLATGGVTVEQWRILQALADGRGHSMGDLARAALMPHPTPPRPSTGSWSGPWSIAARIRTTGARSSS